MVDNKAMLEGIGQMRPRSHAVHIENREFASLTGIKDVLSFNETEIVLLSDGGGMTIEGNELHITKLNLDEGQIIINGQICAIEYDDLPTPKGSIFSRMFR